MLWTICAIFLASGSQWMCARGKEGRSRAEIARLDARWFKARPERRHRVRLAEDGEVQLPAGLAHRPVLMAMRWTGKGCIYQPLFYVAGPPRPERIASILFAMAASDPEPVPLIRAENAVVLARRFTSAEALT
jgi:hypothetical protein